MHSNRTDELALRVRMLRQKREFLMSFHVGCLQDERPRVGLGLLALHNLVKENSYSIVVVACVIVDSGDSQGDNQG